jgi:serine/threonine protein kinase
MPGILRGLTRVDRVQNEANLRANRDSRRDVQLDEFRRASSGIMVRGNLTLLDDLGKGAFGVVKRGKLRRGSRQQMVAAKTLSESASVDDQLSFLQEADIMSNFSHGNVLTLLGIINTGEPIMLIMELMEGGSLYKVLRSDGLTSDDKLKYASDILCGLQVCNPCNESAASVT